MKNLLLSALVLFFVFVSCKNDGCDQPYAFNYDPEGTASEACVYQPINLTIAFEPYFGDHKLEQTDAEFIDLSEYAGRDLKLRFFGIYLSEISYKSNEDYVLLGSQTSDCKLRTDDVHLLKRDDLSYVTTILPEEGFSFEGIRFNIGVEPCRNDSLDPTTQTSGPFKPHVPTMYWSWASGYRFVSLEGEVDASQNADGSDIKTFEYHTGLNSLLRKVELDLDNFSTSGNQAIIEVKVDFEELLADVDFTIDTVTHTTNNLPLATKIADNGSSAFYIIKE
ncbi:MAG: MbnP family protein [Salibacteraceae bacterium]